MAELVVSDFDFEAGSTALRA